MESFEFAKNGLPSQETGGDLNRLRSILSDENPSSIWENHFGDNPKGFFAEKNLELLSRLNPEERLALLSYASSDIRVTPSQAREYFKKFPTDLDTLNMRIEECRGMPATLNDWNTFSLVAREIADKYPSSERFLKKPLEISKRRELAPEFIIDSEDTNIEKMREDFGQAADTFFRYIGEANRLDIYGGKILDTQNMFGESFENLTEEQQSAFLRKCLAITHNDLVFHEVFNSSFSKELVDHMNQPSSFKGHRKAHSMLFKTIQPNSVFDLDQEYFENMMNSSHRRGGNIEEYPIHRVMLSIIRRIGKSESAGENDRNTLLLAEFWNKNRNPIFGNTVSEALSRQNPDLAAEKLLEYLRNEKGNRNALSSILYRLEFGRIGISKEGVRYLEKIYDLGELNDPDLHVSRLTSQGDIGIFDEDLTLIKYFQLGDLSSEETKIRAKIMDFVYETLFLPEKNETEEGRGKRLRYLEEFKKNYYEVSNDKLFSETDVRLNNLSFREQGWFIIKFNEADAEEKEKLRTFVSDFGESGIKTFLSLESDQEMGEKILALGEKLPRETAAAIFRKYSEIVDETEKIRDYLEKNFRGEGEISQGTIQEIVEGILRKGADTLRKFFENLEDSDPEDIQKELSLINSEIVLCSQSFSAIKKDDPETKLSDFKNLSVRIEGATTLSQELRKKLKDISSRNWKRFPDLHQKVVDGLEKSFENENSTFFLLKSGDEIIGFMRLDRQEDGSLYAGSLNIQPDIRNSKMGKPFLSQVLEGVPEDSPVHATAYPKLEITPCYIGSLGFVASGIVENYEGSDKDFFQMTYDRRVNGKYKYFGKRKLFDQEFRSNDEVSQDGTILARFTDDDFGYQEFMKKAKRLLSDGSHVLTFYERRSGIIKGAFEKKLS